MSAPKAKKSSQREPAAINTVVALLVGDQAMAGGSVGADCVAAGYIAETNYNKQKGGLSCGADLQGNVAQQYRGSCSPHQFMCNPEVYGPNGGCVSAGRDTTAQCNRVTGSGNDIPDLNQDNRQRFETLRTKAMAYADEIIGNEEKGIPGVCSQSKNGPLAEDQTVTCQNFWERQNEINRWDCRNPDFKNQYPKLCSGPNQPGPGGGSGDGADGGGNNPPPSPGVPGGSGGPGNGGGTGVAAPVDDREVKCEALGPEFTTDMKASCSRGGMANAACTTKEGKAVQISKCICDNGGRIVGNLRCDGGTIDGKDYDSWKKEHDRRKKKKGPNWLLIFGAGMAGLLAYHFLAKKAVKQSYKNIDPIPAATPVPVDVTAPGAR